MKTSVQNFLTKTMASRKSQDRVQALIDSGVADKLMEEREAERLAMRATLIQKLKAPQKTLDAQAEKIGEQVAKSKKNYEDTVKLVDVAHKQYLDAMATSLTFGYTHQTAIADTQLLLLQTSDPRLAQFINAMFNLRERVRHAVRSADQIKKHYTSGKLLTVHHSNVDELNRATDVILGCVERCRNMQQQAISAREVSANLQNMCEELGPVLMVIDVRAPSIVDGELVEA